MNLRTRWEKSSPSYTDCFTFLRPPHRTTAPWSSNPHPGHSTDYAVPVPRKWLTVIIVQKISMASLLYATVRLNLSARCLQVSDTFTLRFTEHYVIIAVTLRQSRMYAYSSRKTSKMIYRLIVAMAATGDEPPLEVSHKSCYLSSLSQ